MSAQPYIQEFWQHWKGEEEASQALVEVVNASLKETLYELGLIKVRALSGLGGMISEGDVYTVKLVKDEDFPEGEECVKGDNGEWVTLPCFKNELVP